ncbi:MAG: hypothetical protein RLN76_13575 [Phycisphaeraceae bacterium]
MPNGGPDCCGNCSHNRAVQVMAHPHPEDPRKFWKLSHCTLRDVNINNPFWTYCNNFTYGKRPETRLHDESPKGWIFASGLFEGYVRIPWNGQHEPDVATSATCLICGRKTPQGIVVKHEDDFLGFCSNRHYIEWWKTIHHDSSINPEDYQTPEDRYES